MNAKRVKKIRRLTDFTRPERVCYVGIQHPRYVPDAHGALKLIHKTTLVLGDCDRAVYQQVKRSLTKQLRAA